MPKLTQPRTHTYPHQIFQTLVNTQILKTKKLNSPNIKLIRHGFMDNKLTQNKRGQRSVQIGYSKIKNGNFGLMRLRKPFRRQPGNTQCMMLADDRNTLATSQQKQKHDSLPFFLSRAQLKTQQTQPKTNPIIINPGKSSTVKTKSKPHSLPTCPQQDNNYRLLNLVGKCYKFQNIYMHETILETRLNIDQIQGPHPL